MTRDFAAVRAALSSEPGVAEGRMFGAAGLKVGKQVFAMEVKGKLVVKLSASRASQLRDARVAEAFDPAPLTSATLTTMVPAVELTVDWAVTSSSLAVSVTPSPIEASVLPSTSEVASSALKAA